MFIAISHILSILSDVCFPITCCNCGKFVDSEGVCSECWKSIKWISDPKCKICGFPFEVDINAVCPLCLKKKPYFDKAISVFEYNDFSKDIILKFKHGDVTNIYKQLAVWIYRAASNDIKNADIIVPVPIHFFKRLKRKYNQSELLAQEFENLSGIPHEPRILKKTRQTISQEGLSRKQRLKNINGSFSIDERYADSIAGKTVIIIDDVLTTGATANECSKILKEHGTSKIILLTLARVNHSIPI